MSFHYLKILFLVSIIDQDYQIYRDFSRSPLGVATQMSDQSNEGPSGTILQKLVERTNYVLIAHVIHVFHNTSENSPHNYLIQDSVKL